MQCSNCAVTVQGPWETCPLCSGGLAGERQESSLPDVPLRFNPKSLWYWLAATSVLGIIGSLVAVRFVVNAASVVAIVWFSVLTLWAVALIIVRKRRNVAKALVYTVALVGLLSLYADHLWGWHGWSINWVIPILCGSSIVGTLIAVWITRMRVADYIIYLWSAVLLGLVPGLSLIFGWVREPWPSWISVLLAGAAMTVSLLMFRSPAMNELRKRLSV